jgi:hypothetical protein
MYLFESGAVAERFIGALLAAAERGVRIYLLLVDGRQAYTGGTGITDAVEPPDAPALSPGHIVVLSSTRAPEGSAGYRHDC